MRVAYVALSAVLVFALHGVATVTRANAQDANTQDAIIKRLDALEKENAALRARVNHLERTKAESKKPEGTEIPRTSVLDNPASLAPPAPGPVALRAAPEKPRPHFEIGG